MDALTTGRALPSSTLLLTCGTAPERGGTGPRTT